MPKQLQSILGNSEERFRILVDAVQDYAIYLLDSEGHVITWNTGAERNKGYKPSEIIGKSFSTFFPSEDAAAGIPQQILSQAAATGRFAGEGWRLRKNGTRFWASVVVNARRDSEGNLLGFAKVTRDLTERKQQEEALQASEAALHAERDRLQVTLYSIADGVISTDETGRVTMMNPVAEIMSGWKLTDAVSRPIEEILHLTHAEKPEPVKNPVRECLWMGKPIYLQEGVVLQSRDGKQYDIQDSAAPIRTTTGDIIGAVLIFQDVTRIRTIQRELAFSATHDPLTLLPNRKMFLEGVQAALRKAKATGGEHSLCFLDLDRFKIINDTAGHAVGDILLRTVADLLTKQFRESDLVARLGGDEFAVILHGCKPQEALPSLNKVAEAIESLNFLWQDQVFPLSVSIGVAAMAGNSDAATVMKEADVACYAAKHAGRNRISIYREDEGDGHERHQQIKVAADIRDAIS